MGKIEHTRRVNLTYSQIVNNIKTIHLSIAEYSSIEKKNLTETAHTKSGRLSIPEHILKLKTEGILRDTKTPILALSCRNVLANLRCIGFIKGNENIACVKEEKESERPYFILGQKKDGSLSIDKLINTKENRNSFDWFLSGIPVLWESFSEEELFKSIVTEAADHSHVWKIYRGNHPEATEESKKNWEDLQKIFIDTLSDSNDIAFEKLIQHANNKKLEREDNYLHNILGISEDNKTLYQLIGIGKLEDLGQQIKALGATRAICVDNSGSSVVQFYPKGIEGECIQEFAAPNHRPPGTAYLVIELENAGFKLG